MDIQKASQLWKDGLSQSKIAKYFNMTTGQISGLFGRNREIFPKRKPVEIVETEVLEALKEQIKDDEKPHTRQSANALRKLFHEDSRPPEKVVISGKEYDESRLPGFTLWQLENHQCKWPINDGGPFLFCGEVKAGKNYCENHAQRSVRMA